MDKATLTLAKELNRKIEYLEGLLADYGAEQIEESRGIGYVGVSSAAAKRMREIGQADLQLQLKELQRQFDELQAPASKPLVVQAISDINTQVINDLQKRGRGYL